MTPATPATETLDAILQADAEHLPLPDKAVDLVFSSPPYVDARWYGDKSKHSRQCIEWVDWMLRVVRESCRVCKGLVLINCAGVTRKHRYQPAPEMLLSEWWKQGGECWRPAYWHRVGIPGSGGRQWLRADVEYVLAFKGEPGPLSVTVNNVAMGHTPKWAPGGEMSNRLSSGSRVNQWGHPIGSGGTGGTIDDVTCVAPRPSHRLGSRDNRIPANNRLERGNEKGKSLVVPAKANPGTLIKVIVGGGVMGHKLAHENEAPFPVKLANFFIRSFCPKGGIVLDPFGGSGTVGQAASACGRQFICCDIRESQTNLMRRRLFGDGLFAKAGA